jgi:hypothetical protein
LLTGFSNREKDKHNTYVPCFCRENMLLTDELGKPASNTEDLQFPPGYWQNLRVQCMVCLWKQRCVYWKNSEHNVVRFLNTFAVSIMFGIVFWKIGSTM